VESTSVFRILQIKVFFMKKMTAARDENKVAVYILRIPWKRRGDHEGAKSNSPSPVINRDYLGLILPAPPR